MDVRTRRGDGVLERFGGVKGGKREGGQGVLGLRARRGGAWVKEERRRGRPPGHGGAVKKGISVGVRRGWKAGHERLECCGLRRMWTRLPRDNIYNVELRRGTSTCEDVKE